MFERSEHVGWYGESGKIELRIDPAAEAERERQLIRAQLAELAAVSAEELAAYDHDYLCRLRAHRQALENRLNYLERWEPRLLSWFTEPVAAIRYRQFGLRDWAVLIFVITAIVSGGSLGQDNSEMPEYELKNGKVRVKQPAARD